MKIFDYQKIIIVVGYLACYLLYSKTALYAQNSVGIGTTTPHVSAILDVSGTNGGLLVPRMTEAQRNAILSPQAALLIYQTNGNSGFYFFNGQQWQQVGNPSELQITTSGNNTGWRIRNNSTSYGPIGRNAVDLSIPGARNNTGALGNFSFAAGSGTIASGSYSTALGELTTAQGVGSTAWGEDNTAVGVLSTTWGTANNARGVNSTVFGQGNETNSHLAVVFGRYNDRTLTGSAVGAWNGPDPIFMIGNGSSVNNRSNALTILKNGFVGINTASPFASLHMRANESASQWSTHIRLDDTEGRGANILNDSEGLKFRTSWTNRSFSFFNSNSLRTAMISNGGNLTIAGSLTQNSDARLKQDIEPIPNALTQLQQIGGFRYHWKSEDRDDKLHYDLLAQQVQEVLPHLVSADEKGTLSVNYIELIPLLIEGMKAQQERIEELERKVGKTESPDVKKQIIE